MNKLSRNIGLLLIMFGSILAWGWLTHEMKIVSFFSYGIFVKFITSLWFILIGISICFLEERPKISFYLGLFIIGWTLSAFVFEYIYPYIIINNVYKSFRTYGTLLEIPAPNTCICFAFVGLILVLNRFTHYLLIVVINLLLSFTIASLGLVACIGYALQITTAYGWVNLTEMSLMSAIIIFIIGFTLIYKYYLFIPKEKKIIYLPLGSFIFISIFSGLLWVAVYQFENRMIESVLRDHLNQNSQYITKLLNEVQSAFWRFKARMDDSSSTPSSFWKKDAESSIHTIIGLKTIALINRNNIKEMVNESQQNDRVAKNNIAQCMRLSDKKTINYIFIPEYKTMCFSSIIEKNSNFDFILFIYDFKELVKPIENHDIENWYKIGVTYEDKTVVILRDTHKSPSNNKEIKVPLFFKNMNFFLYGVPSDAFLKELGSNLPFYLIFFSLVFAILWSVIILYIVKEKKHENVINELNKKLQVILNSSHLSIIATNKDGIITLFNHAAERILGYSAKEVIGIHTPELFHDQEEISKKSIEISKKLGRFVKPGFDTFVAQLDKESNTENEWTYISKTGKRIPILLSVAPMRNQDNQVYGYVAIALDISERKEVDKMKNEFISIVSHELRTPLTSIHGSIILLIDQISGPQTTESMELLNIALNNTDRLIRLINDILDLEKIESGKMKFSYELFNVNDLIKESVTINQLYAKKFSVNLDYNLLPTDIYIKVDHDRMIQLLTNLISNAIKFSPQNEAVVIDAKVNGDQVIISVTDKGKGIPADFQKIIFNKFAQADSSPIRKQQGTGLGLNISKQIVDAMGGYIHFDTKENVGTSFRVAFEIDKEKTYTRRESDVKKIKILHIEDDTDLYKVLSTLLKKEYVLDQAKNIDSAKSMFEKNKYALIILDLKLLNYFAYELLPYFYEKNVPVIVLSSYDLPQEYEKYAKCVLIKSKVSNDAIVKTIHDTIEGIT